MSPPSRPAMESPGAAHDPDGRKAAYVETYGCQMNISDGELMEGILRSSGYRLAESPDQADVILVNTCAIREHAEQRVLGRVAELNRIKLERPAVVIGVTGCMAQRMGERLLEDAGYVDLVMGPDGYRRLPEVLAEVRPSLVVPKTEAGTAAGADAARDTGDAATAPGTPPAPPAGARVAKRSGELPVLRASPRARPDRARRLAVLDFEAHENYEGLEVHRRDGISAWVPVQRGCNYRCTYCIVPYVRGSEKNRDPAHVLAEVREIADSGISEVTLLGQTVNSYAHEAWDFPRLLRAVARIDGIRRVRFTSPHPNDVTPALVEVMATEEAVCEQLHLPVQAGADRTLKRMLRRYTVASYMDTVRMLRDAMPELALSTDIIVAFPGETDAEFRATLELVREVRYDDAFLYKYSAREGTPATRLPVEDFLPEDVAQARLEELIDVQRAIQAEINRAEVGRVEELLVERPARSEGDMLGRSGRNKVVAFPGTDALIGRYVHARLTGTTGATFTGERVEPPAASRVA